jgi:hypothetical protein
MKIATTVKELITLPVRRRIDRANAAKRAAEPPFWLPGEQHPGQASDYESWPPTAQNEPAGPGSHQPRAEPRSPEPQPNA